MKAIGAFLLLGFAYGFEDDEFIAYPAHSVLHHPHIYTQSNDHFQQLSGEKDLFLNKTKKKVISSKNTVDELLSTQKVAAEEITLDSELLRAIKRTKDNELISIKDRFKRENPVPIFIEKNEGFQSFMRGAIKSLKNLEELRKKKREMSSK